MVRRGHEALIRLLGLALYGTLAASTRHRLGQYVAGLAAQGIDLRIHSLLGDEYLRRRFAGTSPSWPSLLAAGGARFRVLLERQGFDAAILHCELLPLAPGWLERSLLPRNYIYDFDDAFFLKYRRGRLGLARPFLGGKFDSVIQGAAAVTAGNAVLAEYGSARNGNTHLLPTVVDTTRYVPAPGPENGAFTVGWIGSPSTAPYLSEVVRPLSVLGAEGPVRLVVVGGKAPTIPKVAVQEVQWSESTEVAEINGFDVGIMPLPDDEWTRGKCAFKLIQYMACGVPVIASRVGANLEVVTEDCGFLVGGDEEWIAALRLLRDDPIARLRLGQASRARIEAHYSLKRNLPILVDIIRQAVAGGQ